MQTIDVNKVVIPANRQRKEIKDIESLKDSIIRIGLLNPIIIDDQNNLIAGERRLTAWKELRSLELLVGGDTYAEIPCRLLSSLDETSRMVVELDENIRRQDITWQEQADAVNQIHKIFMGKNPKWTKSQTAEQIGLSVASVSRYLAIYESDVVDEKVMTAPTLNSAMATIKRKEERKRSDLDNKLADILRCGLGEVGLAVPEEIEKQTQQVELDFEIKNLNSIEFMNTYAGERFNLIHCDFPYGIGFETGWDNSADQWGSYEDSPEVYWELCRALARNWNKISSPSSHLIFWFSMKYYSATVEFFAKHIQGLVIDPFPLIWHKSDNKGTVPDPNRGPRRTYETALFGHFGDRKIIRPVANSVSLPTQKSEAIHISEKPEHMLNHFLSMVVDSETTIFDPTCGSGAVLRAAHALGARRGLGLELNPEYAIAAQNKLTQALIGV